MPNMFLGGVEAVDGGSDSSSSSSIVPVLIKVLGGGVPTVPLDMGGC
jgi:hypothetical protein